MNKKEELTREQLEQVTSGTGDDTGCDKGLSVMAYIPCEWCGHKVQIEGQRGRLEYQCALGVSGKILVSEDPRKRRNE